jgi:peptidoglycan hydrolase-like protein with peptidoglycan-binding domain
MRADDMHVEVIVPLEQAREMVKALQAPPPLPAAPGSPVLRRGSSGPKVRDVQNALRVGGFPLTLDGDFGPATDRALRAFQAKHGLTADGVVGPKTWVVLRKVVHG